MVFVASVYFDVLNVFYDKIMQYFIIYRNIIIYKNTN